MEYKLLSEINSPKDIKKLDYTKLNELSGEIRYKLIETVSENGGHLASNLGMEDAIGQDMRETIPRRTG